MEIRRVFDLIPFMLGSFPKEDALASKVDGSWKKISTQEYADMANTFSYAFLESGIAKGDKVATISNNRYEWNFIDMGLSQIGAVHVPIYPTLSTDDYTYILDHSDAKILIVSDKLLYKKIKPVADKTASIKVVYTINEVDGAENLSQLQKMGAENVSKWVEKLVEIKKTITPEDIASIIYTSGTTGVSKGVMLTHDNFVSNFKSARHALPLNHEHRILSFLPLCHVYERLLNYLFQFRGISIYYAQNIGTIVDNLKEIKADGFDTVPRLLEKVYDSIMQKGEALTGIKRKLFFWAVSLGLKYELNNANGVIYNLQLKIANKLIFSKWREALGGHIKFIGSGGAALQPRLARLFWAAGIPIQEGYGLTETSPLIAFNYPAYPNLRFGTVGPVIEGVTVKIADDGEILVKGNNVMKGYYKNEEMTKEVMDDQGWLHTGDVGVLEDGKFLRITDRKKEIFKLSSGKYIAPQVVENKLKESSFIEQVMVIGENQKTASAIISPSFEALQPFARQNGLDFGDKVKLIADPKVRKLFTGEVQRLNKMLGKSEQIAKFEVIKDTWTPETGELSPTLKLRRKVLMNNYSDLVKKLYD